MHWDVLIAMIPDMDTVWDHGVQPSNVDIARQLIVKVVNE